MTKLEWDANRGEVNAAVALSVDSNPARAVMALRSEAGETSTNLLQPFFLLIVLPVMGAGVLIQARDVMGYLVLPFVAVYALTALVLAVPL